MAYEYEGNMVNEFDAVLTEGEMIDTKKTEKIAPEVWLNSQLSVARFSGGCIINGARYVVDPETKYLVREDIWRKELKEKSKKKKAAAADKAAAQGEMFGVKYPV